jgi:sulfate adenylyltransferase subunit 2
MENLTHLERIESESIHIIREVVSTFDNPVMLYSIGKDSAVMLHLASKAFYPGKIPFPLLHVDTGWKLKEMISFREKISKLYNVELLVHKNKDGIKDNVSPFTHGSKVYTNIMKTDALKQALNLYNFDSSFGGARRDEEKSRSKERIFSFRNKSHHWNPKMQRPEIWSLYNTHINNGESVRVFPLSNWTELDIWQYIAREKIPIVPLYFAKVRPVIETNNMLIMVDDDRLPITNKVIKNKEIRFRTLGCYPLTAAIESEAKTVEEIIIELLADQNSERQGRLIDQDQIGSMEKKKMDGYF